MIEIAITGVPNHITVGLDPDLQELVERFLTRLPAPDPAHGVVTVADAAVAKIAAADLTTPDKVAPPTPPDAPEQHDEMAPPPAPVPKVPNVLGAAMQVVVRPATQKSPGPPVKWTPERVALVEQKWGDGLWEDAILPEVNKLPGPHIETSKAVWVVIKKCHFKRRPGCVPDPRKSPVLASDQKAAIPEPQPNAAAPRAAEPPPITSGTKPVSPAPEITAAPSPAPVVLPLPRPYGRIEIGWNQATALARKIGLPRFNGDMEGLNQHRRKWRLPEFVLVEPFGPGSSPSGLAPAKTAEPDKAA